MAVIARSATERTVAVVLSLALSQVGAPAAQAASGHVVGSGQVTARLAEDAALRGARVKLVQEALDGDAAKAQARAMGANPGKLRAAVPHLADAELADLAGRAQHLKDVTAGHSTNDGALIALGVIMLVSAIVLLVALNDGYYYDDYCYC
jgi:hypothetical protein